MAFQAAPNIARITNVYRLPNGQAAVNVFHAETDVEFGWNSGTLLTLANNVYDWVDEVLQPAISNQVTYLRTEAVDLTMPDGAFAVTTRPSLVGLSPSPAMPSNVTLSIKWSTGFTGRNYRGRTYHIGLNEAQVAGDYVNAGAVETLQGMYSQLIAAVAELAGTSLCVLSRVSGGVPRPVGVGFPIVQASIVDNRVDTQRRRLPRVTL